MAKTLPILLLLLSVLLPGSAVADEDYVGSLITATPYEGRQLAIKLARKSIGEMQSDSAVKKEVRAVYSRDGAILIEAAEVIAIEFATIAAANNYWRE
ncbi:MAG: hexameric tyrosine-coordinated heme protein [Gammaproteobacteria bacterium]|nr:hexameric tyrosine-coordinated heme protein [Gammaproteobacteria bacterium]